MEYIFGEGKMSELKIKQERLKRNWSQSFVSQKLDITKSAFANIEKGKRNPSFEVLIKLENLFNLSHRELFEQLPDKNILTKK